MKKLMIVLVNTMLVSAVLGLIFLVALDKQHSMGQNTPTLNKASGE